MRNLLTALLLLLGASAMASQAGQTSSDQALALETTIPSVAQYETPADNDSIDGQPDETVDFIAAICYLLVTIGCFSLFFHIIGEDKNANVPAS